MIAYRLESMDEPGLYRIVIADTGQPVLVIDSDNLQSIINQAFEIHSKVYQREYERKMKWTTP